MTSPFLVQVYSTGGPPTVEPNKVKVGGVAINDGDSRYTSFTVMTPRPIEKQSLKITNNHRGIAISVCITTTWKKIEDSYRIT